MRQNFIYTLLITWFLLAVSCKTNFVPTSFHTQNISVSDNASRPDSQIIHLYLPFKNILEKDMKRVISVSEKEMIKNKPESKLTNFLADLLLEEAIIEVKARNFKIKPELSYFNYGGIRTYLPQGEITVGNIYELMPFENEMVFLKLNGDQVQEFLNNIAKKGGESVGGVRFSISNNNNKASNIKINGKSLQPNLNYWLATNDYIAEGGDGLTVLTQRLKIIKSGKKIRDLMISHLEKKYKNGEKLVANLDGRVNYE